MPPGRKTSDAVTARGRGFTLLELIVVMALIAVISAAVVPVYGRSMSAIQLRNVRNDFVSLVSFVQEKAVAESKEYRVCIDSRDNVYWVMVLAGYDDRNEKVFKPVEAEYGVEKALPEGYVIERVDARKDRETGARYIGCYPNGACDEVDVTFRDQRNRRRTFKVTTLGAMGKFEVKE